MTTPIIGITEVDQAQANKYLTINEAIRVLEALMFRANSMTTDAEPAGSPVPNGVVYIQTSTATGTNWATFSTNDVAVAVSGTWYAFAPWEGLTLWIMDLDNYATWDGSSWQLALDKRGPLKITDRDLSTLPTSPIPASGSAYIVAEGSPQQFTPDQIAIADGAGNWVVHTPEEGDLVYIIDEKVFSSYNTGSPLGWTTGISI